MTMTIFKRGRSKLRANNGIIDDNKNSLLPKNYRLGRLFPAPKHSNSRTNYCPNIFQSHKISLLKTLPVQGMSG